MTRVSVINTDTGANKCLQFSRFPGDGTILLSLTAQEQDIPKAKTNIQLSYFWHIFYPFLYVYSITLFTYQKNPKTEGLKQEKGVEGKEQKFDLGMGLQRGEKA